MVHITDMKKITLTEQVADEYEQLGKEGRFSKKCIPRGYIPDFDWTTIHQDQDQPIKPIKQQDPTEDTTTPAAPTEVEGPPSSHLRSKTKQQSTSNEQGQPECNPTPMDPPEHNPAEIEVNTVDIAPIIQLKIPPHLSAPTELKFEKERLAQEETIEEYCCNLILPRPFHPQFSSISFKHPTRCLAAAAHFLIRKELFNSKYPQLQVAKDFAVAEKKLHLATSGRKYDPGTQHVTTLGKEILSR